jgi:hypothetical protein
MRTRLLFLSLVLLTLPGVLRADYDDPPERVARLGYFSGSVSFRPADADDWAPASANYPLTEGDHLWTDDDGRGELRVGGSTVVRLAPRTAFSFLNLDDNSAQMRISEGGVTVTIGDLDRDEVVEVDTPDAAVSLLERGFYRIEVTDDGSRTIVTVRRGQADVTSGGASVVVHSGDAIVIDGGDSPRYDVRDAEGPTDWEDWAVERDRRYEGGESRRYVSAGVVGYQDLDDHGRWRDDTEYGHVWVPTTVAVDWAPYRYGHWAYVQPWGWTWVDDASWGFAPFHYGRWAHRSWGWCWVPGTIVARPVYAPALVAFVGGADFSVSVVAGGGVGWFPLAPREVYVPPYRHSTRYIQNVNVTNVNITNVNVTNVNVTNVNYANRHVGGAVTVVNRETFVSSRPVGRATVNVSTQNLDRAQVRTAVVQDIRPRRESIMAANVANASIRKPPVQVQERKVVTRAQPPAPRARVAVEGVKPAPVRPTLVKSAVEPGRDAKLRPVREGLPKAEVVRPGEKPQTRPHVDDRNTGRPTDRGNDKPAPVKSNPRDQGERPTFEKPQQPKNGGNDKPTPKSNPRDQGERPTYEKPQQPKNSGNDKPVTKSNPRDQGERPTYDKPQQPRNSGNDKPVTKSNPRDQGERPTTTKATPHPPDERNTGRPTDRGNNKPATVQPSPRDPDRPTMKKDQGTQTPPFRPVDSPKSNDKPTTSKSDRSDSNDRPGSSKASPTSERPSRGDADKPKSRDTDKPKGKDAKATPTPVPKNKGNR